MATTQDARKKMTMSVAQENLYSYNIARQVCRVDTQTMGTIYNPYTSLPAIATSTGTGPDYDVRAYTAQADSLQVNERAKAAEHVDSYDWKSVNFGLINDRGMNYGKTIANQIDRAVFTGVVGNGGFAIGDGGVDGVTTPWTITDSNVDDMIGSSIETIDVNEGHGKRQFMVVSPREASKLRLFLQGTGNVVADETLRRGVNYVGTTVNDVDIYQTNNLQNQVTLDLSTAVTAGDSVTINGVTMQWVSPIGTDAGNVLRSTTAATNATNLANLINNPRTTDANQVALSEEDAAKFDRLGIEATADGTDVVITAKATLVVSDDLTDGDDGFGSVARYVVTGAYESIFLALPTAGMDYHEKEVSGKAGRELYMEQFYSTTIWTRQVPLVGTILTTV